MLDLDVSGRMRAFEEIGRLLQTRHYLKATQVVERLSLREQLGSTGLGQGVALPHARIKGLPRAVATFLRPKSLISFDAPDGKPVSEILVLLVPERVTEQHLALFWGAALRTRLTRGHG
jgi:nitrogen PTS system EIIA component